MRIGTILRRWFQVCQLIDTCIPELDREEGVLGQERLNVDSDPVLQLGCGWRGAICRALLQLRFDCRDMFTKFANVLSTAILTIR